MFAPKTLSGRGVGRRGFGHVLTSPPTTAEAGVVSDDFFASVSSVQNPAQTDSSGENSSLESFCSMHLAGPCCSILGWHVTRLTLNALFDFGPLLEYFFSTHPTTSSNFVEQIKTWLTDKRTLVLFVVVHGFVIWFDDSWGKIGVPASYVFVLRWEQWLLIVCCFMDSGYLITG